MVDLGVEEDEHSEGNDSEDDEPEPGVVVHVVVLVEPELRDGNGGLGAVVHPVPVQLGLEELWDVEDDGERDDGNEVLEETP